METMKLTINDIHIKLLGVNNNSTLKFTYRNCVDVSINILSYSKTLALIEITAGINSDNIFRNSSPKFKISDPNIQSLYNDFVIKSITEIAAATTRLIKDSSKVIEAASSIIAMDCVIGAAFERSESNRYNVNYTDKLNEIISPDKISTFDKLNALTIKYPLCGQITDGHSWKNYIELGRDNDSGIKLCVKLTDFTVEEQDIVEIVETIKKLENLAKRAKLRSAMAAI